MPDVRQNYLSRFEELARRRDREHLGWLRPVRKAAIERFGELGFPTRRNEDWKYTNVAPVASTAFELASVSGQSLAGAELQRVLKLDAKNRLVFVNGRYQSALSELGELPRHTRVENLGSSLVAHPDVLEPHLAKHARYADHAFAALNTAFFDEGALIQVPADTAIDAPFHLVFISTTAKPLTMNLPRILILAGAGSRVTVVESYWSVTPGQYLTNAVTEIVLAENASVQHYKLQEEGPKATHIALLQVDQDKGSHFSSHSIALGGALARNELRVLLNAEGAECKLNGLYVASGSQHLDNTTFIDHAKPRCTSRELYKGVLDDHATGVFSGRVLVRENAAKTDASQANQNLLLSDDASVDTKPQLAIYADDVKCTHGAAVGQLDEDALFYVRSRGLDQAAAKSLLTYAFASEMVDRIELEALRAGVRERVTAKLPGGELLGNVA